MAFALIKSTVVCDIDIVMLWLMALWILMRRYQKWFPHTLNVMKTEQGNTNGVILPPTNEVSGKVIFSQTSPSDWLPSMDHRSHDWGSCLQGRLPPGGLVPTGEEGLHQGESASRGSASRGVGQTPLRYMGYYGIWSTNGQYASYWNAFLF